MKSIMTLRGLVLSKYRTIGNFADRVGWKRNKASRILNGKQKMDIEDIEKMAQCLEINSQKVFMQIFFDRLSTLWTEAA